MGPIVIQRANGSPMPLFQTEPIIKVERAEQVKSLMSEDVVNITVQSAVALPFNLGDRLDVFGDTYKLNLLPTARRAGNFLEYDLVMEGPQYDLLRAIYLNTDASGGNTGETFTLTGNLQLFLNVLINNAARVFGAGVWVLDGVPDTATKTESFSGENCLSVLQKICKSFEQEFTVTQTGGINTIHIGRPGNVLTHKFEYGNGNGLYSLTRTVQKDKGIITRLFAYGGSRNLPRGYRGYAQRLQINDAGYIEASEQLIAKLGVHEATQTWDEIYPHREAPVTALVPDDVNSFIDTGMDFDLNEKIGENTTYLVAGSKAKIKFNTGNLAGYEFEVSAYDHAAKKFTLVPYKDQTTGQAYPDSLIGTFQIQAGDKYVLLDITMPASYVTAAEGALATKAQALLDQSTQGVPVQYALGVDSFFLKDSTEAGSLPNFFELGDFVPILDVELDIDRSSRVTAFRRNVLSPYLYDVTIADSYEVKLLSLLVADRAEVRTLLRINNLSDPNTMRAALRNQQELLGSVFDTDGYLDPVRIKPLSIETSMIAVGVRSQQFQLRNIVIEPNYRAQKNTIRVNGGQLIHLNIADTIKTWNIGSGSTGFADDNSRYIYARCSRSGTTGSIVFSEDQIKVDDQPTVWNFLIGVLHSVDPTLGIRQISLTYGSTTINGRTIKTGVLMSADGKTFFDLDNGEIGGKITFRANDGQMKNVADQFDSIATLDFTELNADIEAQRLSILGLGTSVDAQGNTLSLLSGTVTEVQTVLAQVQAQADGGLTDWFYNGAPTLSNLPAAEWTSDAIKDTHIHDRYYDTINYNGYRFIKTGSVYSWTPIVDQVALNALNLASQAKDTADGKRRVFVNLPAPPYDVGDLWVDGIHLRRCAVAKIQGQSYHGNDWVIATYYDNTVTTINGGIITSGVVQLAGDGGSVQAGISGVGTLPTSVRVWGGGTFENRHLANWRALQSGVNQSKTRYELLDQNENVVGGMSGRTTGTNADIGFWMGGTGPNDASAPTRINYAGKMFLKDAEIGGWQISGQGIINQDGGAYIIARSNTTGNVTEARIGANVFPATFFGKGAALFQASEVDAFSSNYAAVFSAKNARYNYALYAHEGMAMLSEALINGRAGQEYTLADSTSIIFDPSLNDAIVLNPTGTGSRFMQLSKTPSLPLGIGKEVTIHNKNNARSLTVFDTLRGIARRNFDLVGGGVLKLFWDGGGWQVASNVDNNDY